MFDNHGFPPLTTPPSLAHIWWPNVKYPTFLIWKAIHSHKQLVESYFPSQGTEYARLLADDVELVDWDSGVPASRASTRGKSTFSRNRGRHEFQFLITRLTEEDNVVVAEGFARGAKKAGGAWTGHFCNTFDIEKAEVKRVTSHRVDVKETSQWSKAVRH